MAKDILTFTDNAKTRIKEILDNADDKVIGVKFGVKTQGCTGKAYTVEYVEEAQQFDQKIEVDGMKVFISPDSMLFLLGTEVDFKEGDLGQKAFEFNNPNAGDACGCGESFEMKQAENQAKQKASQSADANQKSGVQKYTPPKI